MTSTKNVVRACDSCLTKRARWYCGADDAFLCQACDSSVHSANPLARRHERVRLKTVPYRASDTELNCAPSWHHGFTKKARTPRHGKHSTPKCWIHEGEGAPRNHPFHLVPEEGSDEVNSHEENEEQLLYRVPMLEPLAAELCSPPSSSVGAAASAEGENKESKVSLACSNHLHGFLLPSDPDDVVEFAEFAADVESLLGNGLESECVGMEELGLLHSKEEESWECSVKMEEEESPEVAASSACKLEADQMEMGIEPFDYESHETCDEVKEMEKVGLDMRTDMEDGGDEGKRKILLHLDYEAVITAWASHKSPWTTGNKPNLDPHHCMGTCVTELHDPYGKLGGFGCHPVMVDGGREARVSRYREKRRTRLFSKKIRYEVRKLNAEKRPRMKGRFVKRASIAAPTFPLINK